MKTQLIGLAAAALFAGTAAAQATTTLTLDFDTGSREGAVMVAVFDNQAAFDGDGAPVRAVRTAPGQTVRLDGLEPGRYAVKSFHDVNGDGRMGMNPFGIPTEPFAFSNNAQGHMGPARWDDAAFTVDAAGGAQRLSLK